MKIAKLEIVGVAVPLNGEYKTAHSSKSVQKSVIVKVSAASGETGYGNVDPSPGYSKESVEQTLQVLEACLGPCVLGLDPSNIHALIARMDDAVVGYLDAKAALEMACIDLTARKLEMPVHAYLGGAVKPIVLFNAWIGIVPAEAAAREASEWKRRGFRSAKIKVGGGILSDTDRIKAVRDAVGPDFQLRIDANAGYDADTSIELAHMVRLENLQLFEQPVGADDISGMARVRREAGGIPVMADESLLDEGSLIRIIREQAADIVKIKVMKQGGLYKARQMIAMAQAANIRCVVGHGFGLGINTMAEIMLASTTVNVIDGIECVGPLKTADDIITDSLDLSSGSLSLPCTPGLGVTIDPGKVDRYCFQKTVVA